MEALIKLITRPLPRASRDEEEAVFTPFAFATGRAAGVPLLFLGPPAASPARLLTFPAATGLALVRLIRSSRLAKNLRGPLVIAQFAPSSTARRVYEFYKCSARTAEIEWRISGAARPPALQLECHAFAKYRRFDASCAVWKTWIFVKISGTCIHH